MVVVRIFKLQNLIRFMRVFHLLTSIREVIRAQLEFHSSSLKFLVFSDDLYVILNIQHPFLLHYQPPSSSNFLRIHDLKEFRDHLRDRALTSSTMDFNLDHRCPPLAALTFHDDDSGARFTRILRVSNTDYVGSLEDIAVNKCVSIDSEQLKRIVMEFMNINKVNVVLTDSQVSFSCEFKKPITFNLEHNECIISGVDAGERIEYPVTFRPTSFFCDFASLVERAWFYHETTKTHTVLSAPIGFNSSLAITFRIK